MSATLTTHDAILKEHYTPEMVEDMVYRNNPLFAMVKKNKNGGGKYLVVPTIYGNPQGRSHTFTNAQTNGGTSSSKLAAFNITRVLNYSIATIDNHALLSSETDAHAFMEIATTEIDGAINALTRSIATELYRDGVGLIGRRASISTNTITLSDSEDTVNFEVGMVLVATPNSDGSSPRSGSATVTAVDRTGGTVTVDSAAGITSFADNDYLAVQGDLQSAISGLEAWVPASAPSATAFFGVDRSVDTRLGGLRLDGSSLPIEEALLNGAAIASKQGATITHFFMSHNKYNELTKALGSRVQYVDLEVGRVGFSGLMIQTQTGPAMVVADKNCPDNRSFGLQLDTWTLYSAGETIRPIDTDGLQMLRQSAADGVEVRYGFYGNLVCKAPGYNINIQL